MIKGRRLGRLRGTGRSGKLTRLDLNPPRRNGLKFLRELRLDPVLQDSGVFIHSQTPRPRIKIVPVRPRSSVSQSTPRPAAG